MVGNAALRAAQALKELLVAAAARRLNVDPAQVEWLGERCCTAGGDASVDFAQVVQAALADAGTLSVKGTWSTPPETQGGSFRGAVVGSTAGFSYGAQVVEVEVDEDSGQVRVRQVWAAHDCGRAINPLAVEGQVQGAVWMGLGQALAEETQYHDGLHLRANLLDYRIGTAVESPPIDVCSAPCRCPRRMRRAAARTARFRYAALRLHGTEALLGRPVDDAAAQALGKLVARQATPMRSMVTAANHRRSSRCSSPNGCCAS